MNGSSSRRRHLAAFALFLVFFALLFVQYPVAGHVGGNIDTWLGFGIGEHQVEAIKSVFTGETVRSSMYPARGVSFFGDTIGLLTLVRLALWPLGSDYTAAYYILITLVFASSAFGVYLFATHFVRRPVFAVFAGLVFATTNYIFANIDDFSITWFFFCGLCLHFLMRALDEQNPRALATSMILGGVGVYASVHVFVLQTMMLGLLFVCHARCAWSLLRKGRAFWHLAWYVAIPLPLIVFHVVFLTRQEVMSPWPVALVMDGGVLSWGRVFLGVLPDNLLYPAYPATTVWWAHLRTMAFVGFGTWILATVGFFTRRDRWPLVVFVAAGLAFSLGVRTVAAHGQAFDVPFYYAFWDGLADWFRMPCRFFFVSAVGLSVLAGAGAEALLAPLSRHRVAFAAALAGLVVLHLAENVPVPLRGYPLARYSQVPEAVQAYFADKPRAVIYHLPSSRLEIVPFADDDLCHFNRETIYMLWQVQHNRYIVNGLNGYVPVYRIRFQYLAAQAFVEGRPEFTRDLARLGVTHVTFHKDLVLPDDGPVSANLARDPHLTLVARSRDTLIYALDPPPSRPLVSPKK